MKQFNKPFLKIIFAIITLCIVAACSNDNVLNDLDETIFVRHKNADMPAYVRGNASEKVFLITLHGGPGGTGLGFTGKAFDAIENKYGVVYFDQRGSGNSQGHYSENDLSIDLMVEDVLALVKVMKYKFGNEARFFLLGGSWGGTLGTATLLKDQSNFKGWIEVDGANNPTGLYDMYIETFIATANTQIALGNNINFWETVIEFVNQVDPVNNLDDFLKLNNKAFEAEEKLFDDGFIASVENGIRGNESFFAYNFLTKGWNNAQISSILVDDKGLFQTVDFTSQLPEITIPSLFISGQYDMVVPIASAINAYQAIGSPSKDLLIFKKSGHGPMFSEPDRFTTEVLRFIDEHK
ncbi:alpha/beta fold hydrolase [Hyunsoonleella pacifica]|uniref:Alpha/beta hydrolase n=1 Tax=Hyunsoonleella pacifica TaxID=1080224 RepID=A0A4Q9FUP7_9FLAO|nr:alpha/beta hydrolase [Hyunsoonleella pacifica]TBN17799.1 alpha/beta hydrolase [Hyunsoonleella pacifica]GGD08879.1 alpha/beta hydrolase [Hyunsoonleella pacifica]